MKLYELSLLFHPDLESTLDAPLEKVKKILTENGAEIATEVNDGKKRLAYRINNQDFAVYVFMDVKIPAENVKRIQTTLNITDEVLRYLLVLVDEKARKSLAESKQRAESRDQRDANESEG